MREMYFIVNNETGVEIAFEEDYGNAAELWMVYEESGMDVSIVKREVNW